MPAMVQVAVSISAADITALQAQAAAAKAAGADLVEVRLDTCAKLGADLDATLAAIRSLALPAIVTIRHHSEGGDWNGSDEQRTRLFAIADRSGAAYIDCELAFRRVLSNKPEQAKLILSFHDFAGMGGNLVAVVERMMKSGADIAKIAVTPDDAADLAIIENLYHQTATPLVAIAMGEIGLPSRLLAGAWGAHLTFARVDDSPGSAPGQPNVTELKECYRISKQGPHTRIFGVIGNPIIHSLSPLIHNAAFASHGLDAVYVPFLVKNAKAFWEACNGWIDGLSITIPHKQELLESVDLIEDVAQRIGAINTIYRDEDHRPIGANTDASAAVECIERQVGTLAGRHVTILGAGGVSRAIAFSLRDRGAELVIANRTLDRAQELAAEVGAHAVDTDHALKIPYEILINCTAAGMDKDPETPWPASAHQARTLVFDTIYTPLETRLIKEAQMAGAITICGLSMFISQARGQYKRWTGLDAPEALMHRLALERLSGSEPGTTKRYNTATLQRRLDGAVPP
jgi:3-dehydroquinate dehydratase / shikimate dehydrogenase